MRHYEGLWDLELLKLYACMLQKYFKNQKNIYFICQNQTLWQLQNYQFK